MTVHKPCTERARRQFSHAQHVAAPPEAVFPLLCPVREYDWIPEWDCRLVYTESGVAEPGCVFQTDRPADGGLDTWVISRHEPPARVGFVRMNPLRAMQYDIRLEPADGNSTVLTWEQVITSLCDEGDRHVAALRETDFVQSITGMEALLNRYLKEESTPEAED
jgi:hypothetical protein